MYTKLEYFYDNINILLFDLNAVLCVYLFARLMSHIPFRYEIFFLCNNKEIFKRSTWRSLALYECNYVKIIECYPFFGALLCEVDFVLSTMDGRVNCVHILYKMFEFGNDFPRGKSLFDFHVACLINTFVYRYAYILL